MSSRKILLGHGSGGSLMHALIKEIFLPRLHNPILNELADSARINYREKIAFTTDSFVVSPLVFPGADIGKLAVCGTVNDLVMAGALPEYLSLALVIEEGLEISLLEKIADSVAATAKKAGVTIVTGDLKVVERGACDKLFVNTSGLGRIVANRKLAVSNIENGDKIILSGNIAAHGLSILAARKNLELGFGIRSDCACLNHLIIPVLKKINAVKFMRDPTRGGLATTLNEIVQNLNLGIAIEEKSIPLAGKVKAACELLGIDPLYMGNEGVAVMVVKKDSAAKITGLLREHPLGRNARIIGTVVKEPKGLVTLRTVLGTERIIDMLTNEPLPRIC